MAFCIQRGTATVARLVSPILWLSVSGVIQSPLDVRQIVYMHNASALEKYLLECHNSMFYEDVLALVFPQAFSEKVEGG